MENNITIENLKEDPKLLSKAFELMTQIKDSVTRAFSGNGIDKDKAAKKIHATIE